MDHEVVTWGSKLFWCNTRAIFKVCELHFTLRFWSWSSTTGLKRTLESYIRYVDVVWLYQNLPYSGPRGIIFYRSGTKTCLGILFWSVSPVWAQMVINAPPSENWNQQFWTLSAGEPRSFSTPLWNVFSVYPNHMRTSSKLEGSAKAVR